MLLAGLAGYFLGGGEPAPPQRAQGVAPQPRVADAATTAEVVDQAVDATPASDRVARAPRDRTDVREIARELLLQGRDAVAERDWLGAAESFRAAIEFDSNADTEGALGGLYLRLAVGTYAYKHLKRAAEMDPDNPDRWIALANAYRLRQEPMTALKHLRTARGLDPALSIEKDENGFAYRADYGPESVFSSSEYLPVAATRRSSQ